MNSPHTRPAPVAPLFAPYTPQRPPRHIIQENAGAWRIMDTLFCQAIDSLGIFTAPEAAAAVLGTYRAHLVRRFGMEVL